MLESVQNALTNRTTTIWLEEGILHSVVHLPSADYTLEDIRSDFTLYREAAGGQKRPLFIDIRKVKSADREARNFGASAEAAQVISAQAILIDSAVTKMIGNFFLNVSKPPFPTRMFTDQDEALDWLRQYVE